MSYTTYKLSIQVTYHCPTGSTPQLGRADGWVQFGYCGNSFRCSLTVCCRVSLSGRLDEYQHAV